MSEDNDRLTISRLVFELTMSSGLSTDLDVLLERLFALLKHYHELPLENCGAILLLNPRGNYFQVAQTGMPPFWESGYNWNSGIFDSPEISHACVVTRMKLPAPCAFTGEPRDTTLVALPLHIENQGAGYAVMFVEAGGHLEEGHLQFLTDLAHALSGLVGRTLTVETLHVREIELEDARANAIRSLGVAAEYRDNETGWHIMRMTNFAQVIAKAMGVPENKREMLYVTAPMHDVGKIGISDSILLKPGKLTEPEFEVMKTHTTIGVTILTGNDPLIEAAREIAGCHHERWDGQGYPQGLKGEEIPLLARICSVADVFDALTSTRPYKQPWPVEKAAEWIESQAGQHFDPAVVKAFTQAMPEMLRIRELYRDDIIDPKESLSLPPVERVNESWVKWNDDLSIGIDIIDEHHRYLFDLVNELHDVTVHKRGVRNVARLIKALDAYAKVHFRSEESMMAHYDYGGLSRQQHQHHAFEDKVQEFYEELHSNPLVAQFDILLYLRDWLISHIQVEDAQLYSLVSA